MEKTTTARRLKEIMQERNLTQTDIISLTKPYSKMLDVNISKANMSMYVSGKVTPAQDKLYILGRALNVSEAWLMGFDVPKERPKRPEPVSPVEHYLIEIEEIAQNMNESQLSRLAEYARLLKNFKGGD